MTDRLAEGLSEKAFTGTTHYSEGVKKPLVFRCLWYVTCLVQAILCIPILGIEDAPA
ncbi:hypothetical protein [Paenibacillus sp. DMB20]|uniref:hypothetical protein n=1 Tax=Paenibacillus sp. DMB20 TaxID=1642570 RepID=UPI000A549DE5|nr:hypothetical protein [Paenibacillus sp. DMB20]